LSEQWLFVLFLVTLLAAVAAVLWLMIRKSRSKTRRSSSLSGTGWALIFLTSGRMPPPPPESQIEAELNGEKDRLGSRSIDPD
jgi:hypothetical protein